MSQVARIVILEDHALVREALASRLSSGSGRVEIAYSGASISAALDVIARSGADCIVLDLDLGDGKPPHSNIRTVVATGVPVLIVSALSNHATIRFAFDAGVCGFVSKRSDSVEFDFALNAALNGDPYTSSDAAAALLADPGSAVSLSDQERRAMMLYASGLKMRAVGSALGVTEGTARVYIRRARTKYAQAGRPVPTKIEMYRAAQDDGLLA